jgi:hypothetical protein
MTYVDSDYEDDDLPDPMDGMDYDEEWPEEFETELCSACNGSGEGQYEGSSCDTCGGRGEVRCEN